MPGKILFLDTLVRMFLGKIITLIVRLSKGPPSPKWVGIIQSIGSLNRRKRQTMGDFFSFRLSSCPQTSNWGWELHHKLSWFSGFQSQAELYHQRSWFSTFRQQKFWMRFYQLIVFKNPTIIICKTFVYWPKLNF